VYVVARVPERLDQAGELGATPVNFEDGDPVEQIRELRRRRKEVSVNFGRTHDRRSTTLLRDLVVAGRARPGRIVTHHGTLNDAPGFYESFDRRADGS
jgi:threonine dehydrogenase-like Zn-dependent dehydrogenase